MTQIPNLLQKIVGIIAMSIILYFLHLLAHANGFNAGEYVTGVSVALTIIIFSIAYWTFKPDLKRFNVIVTKHDEKFEQRFREKNNDQAREHRNKLNNEFLLRRSQLGFNVFTWVETFQAFADAKHFLQHICTSHPELYEEMNNLMSMELEIKEIKPKSASTDNVTRLRELRKKEESGRISVRQKFDDLQSRIRQQTEDIGGICENCIKFQDTKEKKFKEMKSKLDSFKMLF